MVTRAGVPWQMATGDDVVGCRVEVGKVVIVVVMSARKRAEGGGRWRGFGYAASNGDGAR